MPLKAEAIGGVTEGWARVTGGAIVEGTNDKGTDDFIGGSEDIGCDRGVENE